jgi:hypothetical protein
MLHPKGEFPDVTFRTDSGTTCQTCGRSIRLASDIELSTDAAQPSTVKAFVTGDKFNRKIVLSQ